MEDSKTFFCSLKFPRGTRKDFFEIKIDNLGKGIQKGSPALH